MPIPEKKITNNLENNFNPKEKLDTNHNLKLEKQELEKLGLKVNLSALEKDAIDNAINKATFIPNRFRGEISKIKDPEEKKGYIFLLQFGEKELGKESFTNLIKQIPLKEVSLFLYELLKAEQKKDLLQTASIVLTNEEIKHLKEKILTKNYTQNQLGKLKEFINEQLTQNISSAELVKGTTLSKKLEKNGKNPEKFMKNIDTVFYAYFTDKIPNISQDTTRNMATGLTLTLLKLYNKAEGQLPIFTSPSQILDNLQNTTLIKNGVNTGLSFLNKIKLINKIINKNLNKNNSDKNELLMNPEKFSDFIREVIKNNLNEKQIKEKILANQEKENITINYEQITKDTQGIFNTAGNLITSSQIQKISIIAGLGEEIKKAKEGIKSFKKQAQKAVFENADTIIGMKETLESIGIWKYFKKLISKLLEIIGFKNGWDDFEKAVEEKKFKNVISYLKENLKLENIKKNKDSIFHKGFEKYLTGNNQIQNIKIKGKLSYPVLSYLNSFGDNKTDLTEKLNNYFKTKNFNKLVEKAKIKDFEKNTFSIEEQTQNNKKINVGIINMDTISKVIEANLPTDFSENNQNSQDKYTPTAIISSYKKSNENLSSNKDIKTLLEQEENNFKSIIKKNFGFKNFSYIKYTNAISQIESNGGNYTAKNKTSGALGKYQFMPNTLTDYKNIICLNNKNCNINKVFLNSPIIQEQVMAKYTLSHLNYLSKNKQNLGINNTNDLVGLLGKSHFTGTGNLNKNYSDGNISANTYAFNTKKNYNDNTETA